MVKHKGVTQDCHLCNHKNNTKQGLRRHIKIEHEGLRYECHECDGVFTGKQGVRRHVKSVHKGLKFDCNMCELKLSASSLSTHKQRAHFKATVYGAKTLTETIFSMMIELNSGWRCIQCTMCCLYSTIAPCPRFWGCFFGIWTQSFYKSCSLTMI